MSITPPPTPAPKRDGSQSTLEFNTNYQALVDWWYTVVPELNSLAVGSNTTGNFNNLLIDGSQVYARSNILGTVSQSGGVPTGAVIESGSNANGDYIRFANGTQICWARLSFSTDINTAIGSLFHTSANETWTFPIAFSSASNMSINGTFFRSGRSGYITNWGAGTASMSFRPSITTALTGSTWEVMFEAKGSWF